MEEKLTLPTFRKTFSKLFYENQSLLLHLLLLSRYLIYILIFFFPSVHICEDIWVYVRAGACMFTHVFAFRVT